MEANLSIAEELNQERCLIVKGGERGQQQLPLFKYIQQLPVLETEQKNYFFGYHYK